MSITPTIPAKPANKKRRRRDEILITREILHRKFPNAIKAKGEPKPPLAIGIHREIVARLPEMSHQKLFRALADYTRGPTYQRMLTAGSPRLDLDGKPVGEVSVTQAQHAATVIQRLETAWAERDAAAGRKQKKAA